MGKVVGEYRVPAIQIIEEESRISATFGVVRKSFLFYLLTDLNLLRPIFLVVIICWSWNVIFRIMNWDWYMDK